MAHGELVFEITSLEHVRISSPKLLAVVTCGKAKKKVQLRVGPQNGKASVTFRTKGEEELLVEVYDRHLLTGDELLGRLKLSLWKVITEKHQQSVEPLVGRRGAYVFDVGINVRFAYTSNQGALPAFSQSAITPTMDRNGYPSAWNNQTSTGQPVAQSWSNGPQGDAYSSSWQQGGVHMGYPTVGWEGPAAPAQQAQYPNLYSNSINQQGAQLAHTGSHAPYAQPEAAGKQTVPPQQHGHHSGAPFPTGPAGYPTSSPGHYQTGASGMQVVYDSQPPMMHGGNPHRPQRPARPAGRMGTGLLTGVAAGVLGAMTLDAIF